MTKAFKPRLVGTVLKGMANHSMHKTDLAEVEQLVRGHLADVIDGGFADSRHGRVTAEHPDEPYQLGREHAQDRRSDRCHGRD